MTVTELINQSGLNFTRKQKSVLGYKIKLLASEKGIPHTKVEEVIKVADYPEHFIPEMQTVVLEYLSNANSK